MSNLRFKLARSSRGRAGARAAAALAAMAFVLRRLHLQRRLAGLRPSRRRRRSIPAAILGAGLVVATMGTVLLSGRARPRRSLRQRVDDLIQRGRYALLKAEYRLEETAQETAAKVEQRARAAEQIVEKEVEGSVRGLKASIEEPRPTGQTRAGG